ncbi:MAG: MASE3 domain-containing protein [Halanaerobium sp.]
MQNNFNQRVNAEKNIMELSRNKLFFIFLLLIISVISAYYNFLFFHTLIELWAMLVAVSIFIIAWNTRRLVQESPIVFLGIGYFFIAILTFFHTVTYSGMGILEVTANEPTQFWLAARFLETALLFFLPFYPRINFNERHFKILTAILTFITASFIITIMVYPIFPDALLAGEGLTDFKIYGEYFIVFVMMLSIFNLQKNKEVYNPEFVQFMTAALAASILAELSFTLYTDVYGIMNLIGHIFYLLSFIIVYYTVVDRGLKKPHLTIFKKLNENREEIEKSKLFLEDVLESLSHPFYVIDVEDYSIKIANSAAEEMTANNLNTCYALSHNDNQPCSSSEHKCPLEELKKTKKPVKTVHKHFNSEGEKRYYEVYGYPVLNSEGQLTHMIEYTLDITQRKLTEQKMEVYTKELERKTSELAEAKAALDTEINKAKIIHEKTLPSLKSSFSEYSLKVFYQPAESLGGDLYNFIEFGNKMIFYLSDITGHGLDAAMVSSFVKNTINSYLEFDDEAQNLSPADILTFLEKRYYQENYPDDFFITIIIGIIDKEKNKLKYSTAGFHVKPVYIENKEIKELAAGKLPISKAFAYQKERRQDIDLEFKEDSVLFLSTDGLIEEIKNGEIYDKRHYKILKEKQHSSAEEIAAAVENDFNSFMDNQKAADDVTFMVLKF